VKKKAGRPRKYHSDEERATAKRGYRATTKNVTLDADLVVALNNVADKLEGEMGFRPTLSQAVRYLIKQAAEPS
jgi:hypothetical protein